MAFMHLGAIGDCHPNKSTLHRTTPPQNTDVVYKEHGKGTGETKQGLRAVGDSTWTVEWAETVFSSATHLTALPVNGSRTSAAQAGEPARLPVYLSDRLHNNQALLTCHRACSPWPSLVCSGGTQGPVSSGGPCCSPQHATRLACPSCLLVNGT